MKKRWIYRPEDTAYDRDVYDDFNLSHIIKKILWKRGNKDDLDNFLRPTLSALHDPFLLPDMHKAADRICKAIDGNEPILVYGDYDVDGITGSSIISEIIQSVAGDVTVYIPSRFADGYGINAKSLKRIFDAPEGEEVMTGPPGLVISVDNGVTAFGAANFLAKRSADFIVADHHTLDASGKMPKAHAIVHPGLEGSKHPNKNLCGAGVAFKLGWAVLKKRFDNDIPRDRKLLLLSLVGVAAMGTVGDIVPLVGENRTIVKHGLKILGTDLPSAGVQALVKAAGAEAPLDADSIGFGMGPLINASGRLGSGYIAYKLIVEGDPDGASDSAKYLLRQNKKRKKIEADVTASAKKQYEKLYKETPSGIVLAGPWHEGVVGITASKITEAYNRPAIILSVEDGKAKGSGRTALGVDLKQVLDECKDMLGRYGGHAAAVGMSLPESDIAGFRKSFDLACSDKLSSLEIKPDIFIDECIGLGEINFSLVNDLNILGPFGNGYDRPLFSSTVERIGKPKLMGAEKNHVKFMVRDTDGVSMEAICWNGLDIHDAIVDREELFEIAYRPTLNRFMGKRSIYLLIEDVKL